jgi:hypothetical protein
VIHRQTVFLIDLQRLTNHEVLRRAVTRQSYVCLYLIEKRRSQRVSAYL